MWLVLSAFALAEEPVGMASGRAIAGVAVEEGHREALAGVGVAVEHVFGEHLAGELAVGELVGAEGSEVPIELVLEGVFHPGEHVEPYVGMGPMVLMRFPAHEAAQAHVGGVAVIGTHLWLSHTWGLLLEADVDATFGPHVAVGSEGLAGVVARWF